MDPKGLQAYNLYHSSGWRLIFPVVSLIFLLLAFLEAGSCPVAACAQTALCYCLESICLLAYQADESLVIYSKLAAGNSNSNPNSNSNHTPTPTPKKSCEPKLPLWLKSGWTKVWIAVFISYIVSLSIPSYSPSFHEARDRGSEEQIGL